MDDDDFDFDNLPTRRSSATNSRGRSAGALELEDDDEACIDVLASAHRASVSQSKRYAAVVLDDDDDEHRHCHNIASLVHHLFVSMFFFPLAIIL